MKIKHDTKQIYEEYYDTLPTSEKQALTRFKNVMADLDKDTLAMQVAMYCHGHAECLGVFKKGTLQHFIEEDPEKGSNFTAFFTDGAGANIFRVLDDGDIWDAEGNPIPDFDWFLDAGYGAWQYLPDDFEMWSDR
jgi:hypothetical protein